MTDGDIVMKNLYVDVGSENLIAGLNGTLRSGEVTAVIGASGSGKTTLLHAVAGLVRSVHGTLLIDGEDATTWKDRQWRTFWRDRASFVHQGYGMVPERSVSFNVSLSSRPDRDRVAEALEQVGLPISSSVRAGVLSGGQQQRVGIARVLYKDSQYVFADEPTASLDSANREHVIGLFEHLAEQGRTIVVATHDLELRERATGVVDLGTREVIL